jgi:hypothetical protein
MWPPAACRVYVEYGFAAPGWMNTEYVSGLAYIVTSHDSIPYAWFLLSVYCYTACML